MREKCAFVLVAVVVSALCAVPCLAAVPVTHPPFVVWQAYSVNTERPAVRFTGYKGVQQAAEAALPGFFDIDPGANWCNYVTASRLGVRYTVKSVTLVKKTPESAQCGDIFPSKTVAQTGSGIRLRWPLMYEAPGTVWTLTIVYGTYTPWDDDGTGPNPPAYVHTEVWQWTVRADFSSVRLLLQLFHQAPFGLDEVPLISDEVLYKGLQQKLTAASAAYAAGNRTQMLVLLGEFEMMVMDGCIPVSPATPAPTGPGTGVAASLENPACCKLLVDAEYLMMR